MSTSLAAELMGEYGLLCRTELQDYLENGEPRRHLYGPAAEYPRRGGRSLRASICIASACAFGARPELAVKTACAIELLHSAFLVHDDLEDESEERRGQPTLHMLYGNSVAINVGDALAVMALKPLLDNVALLGPRLALSIIEEAQQMARETIEGQAIELGWRADNNTGLCGDDYLNMVLKKTCWYTTIFPCRVGAIIGRRSASDLDRFVRFGYFLGAAFQIQDDLLNLVGDAERYGKELNGDLLEGKRTLPLIHLLEHVAPEARAMLEGVLSLPRSARTAHEVLLIREQMDRFGSIDYARRVAHALAGAACHEFEAAFAGVPESRDLAFLRYLPAWVIERC